MMLANFSLVSAKAATCLSSGQYEGTSAACTIGPTLINATVRAHRRAGVRRKRAHISSSSLARDDSEIVEVHVAVRLRPQADLSGDGLWQGMLKIELAVEIPFNLAASD